MKINEKKISAYCSVHCINIRKNSTFLNVNVYSLDYFFLQPNKLFHICIPDLTGVLLGLHNGSVEGALGLCGNDKFCLKNTVTFVFHIYATQPLPEWEYNGIAEQVGYRVQYYRVGSQGRGLTHIINDRLEREFTIEDLEEWTEYEVRVQGRNGIGFGPWSQPVRGRTRESGE